jgi:hypothetical protein
VPEGEGADDDRETIKREFLDGELSSIDAIDRLERLGMNPKDAEALVDEWDEGNEEKSA